MAEDFNIEEVFGGLVDHIQDRLESLELAHYGVKGMKWGVRRSDTPSKSELKQFGPEKITRKTRNGEEITLTKQDPTVIHKTLAKVSKSYRDEYQYGANLTVTNSSGKKVGDATIRKMNDDEINLVWLGIKKDARGQGYATAIMEASQEYGKSEGIKKLTLEVPGDSPDARHIYNKLGFKVTKESDGKDDVWGGLTEMEYVFDEAKHSTSVDISKASSKDLELFHYGVKGMRWGVRRDDDGNVPKKTVSEKKTARRESRATKFDDRAAAYRTKISQLQGSTSTNALTRHRNKVSADRYAKKERQALKDAQAKREGKLSRNQKIVAIGAAVTAAYISYKLGRNYLESGEANRAIMKGKAFLEGKDKPEFNKKPEFASKILDADQLKIFVADGINETGSIGGKVNCRRCTMTYEMRRRGYDVKATKTTTGRGQNAGGLFNTISKEGDELVRPGIVGIAFRALKETGARQDNDDAPAPFLDFTETTKSSNGNGTKAIPTKAAHLGGKDNSKKVFEALGKEPNGARGELGLTWGMGGGHSIAWEIVNNKPVIFDTQTGDYFKSPQEFEKYGSKMGASGYTRLDNVDINQDFLMRWMKNG